MAVALAIVTVVAGAPGTAGATTSTVLASSISTGRNHTCASVRSPDFSGIECWGANDRGQLGNGTTKDSLTPVKVPFVNLTGISAGNFHTCAVTTSGSAMCWGSNTSGQLGNGTTRDSSTPVLVQDIGKVREISSGGSFTCALTRGGAVMCWGVNNFGQLGDGNTKSSSKPVQVIGLGSGVEAVDAGWWQACALMVSGKAVCWGGGISGQLGNGTKKNSSKPVDVVGLGSGVRAISGADLNTCAIVASGDIKCWGDNSAGQLGDGNTTDSSTPVTVSSYGGGAAEIAVGLAHVCALNISGDVKCWGSNSLGQLGNGSSRDSSTPVDVVGFGAQVTQVTSGGAGGSRTCAVTLAGKAFCWGQNDKGQLGDGTTEPSSRPVAVVFK